MEWGGAPRAGICQPTGFCGTDSPRWQCFKVAMLARPANGDTQREYVPDYPEASTSSLGVARETQEAISAGCCRNLCHLLVILCFIMVY